MPYQISTSSKLENLCACSMRTVLESPKLLSKVPLLAWQRTWQQIRIATQQEQERFADMACNVVQAGRQIMQCCYMGSHA